MFDLFVYLIAVRPCSDVYISIDTLIKFKRLSYRGNVVLCLLFPSSYVPITSKGQKCLFCELKLQLAGVILPAES